MDWIPVASLVIAIINGSVTLYTFRVNHRHPPYKGRHRKNPPRKRNRR